MITNYLQSGLSTIIPFIILLGILIFVHELGHFMVARWCGVRVEVFSLGFGKKILKYKRGDTTYAISIIPLGGYVKMFGEQPGVEISEEDKKVAFTHKTVWQRIAVVLAGPLMNFFFAILIFFAVSLTGEDAKTPVLGDVTANSPAYAAGFRSGDRLVTVNGKSISTWDDFQKTLNLKEPADLRLDVEVEREGSKEKSTFAVTAKPEANPNPLSSFDFVGAIEGLAPYSAGTTVGVKETSPLKAMGLKTGDTLLSINGRKVTYWRELDFVFSQISPKEALTLEILDGEKSSEKPNVVTLASAPGNQVYSLQGLGLESSELYLGQVLDGSPAQLAGLHKMDRLVSINKVVLQKWEDVIANIKSFDGKNPVALTVLREGKSVELSITPKLTKQMTVSGTEEKRYTIGITPVINMAAPELMTVKASNPFEALIRGTERTWDVSVMTVMSFVRLFQAKISPKNIGGVISIGQAASETFKVGWTQFFQMMAVISVNLFILNLLPVPVLDGGHLVFYMIEVVKGAPLSLRKMEIAQQVGLALLMSLMVFALFNDFSRLLGL